MYVKPVHFRLALVTLVGRAKGTAAGRLFGVDGKTVERALDGGIVSEILIANALEAFELNARKLAAVDLQANFDQFFERRASADDRAEVAA